ncbi:MAG: hypothetical protein KIS92_15720 [Planctomycetota bacterium]|nr:hypothetical protein [Planctomycetota bacterium]
MGIGGLFVRDWVRKRGIPKVFWVLLAFGAAGLIAWGCAKLLSRPNYVHTYRYRVRVNLRHVAVALTAYAFDHGGKFPSGGATPQESLWQLHPNNVSDPSLFLNEEGLRSPPTVPVRTPAGTVDPQWLAATAWVYLEGLDERAPGKVLLFEAASRDGRKVVLKVNGETDSMDVSDLAEALHAQLCEP